MTEGIPITRHPAPPEQVERIRAAVREAEQLNESRLARPEDAEGLYALFSEPKVNAPIYSLPRPLSSTSAPVRTSASKPPSCRSPLV